MRFIRSITLLVAAAGCGGLLACGPVHSVTVGRGERPHSSPSVVREDEGHGPPPWAPAHGYRRKYEHAYQHRDSTVDLVFDSGLGVYIVVGIPNYYYWNGTYVRLNGTSWSRAPYLDARWTPCSEDELPGNLRSKTVKGKKGKSHGHGHGRGHGRDGDQGEDD
jgi:hypothetical protein